jgi:pimeloyl-ACP methyl ester carboxylesterase
MGESYGGLLASGVALSLEDVPQLKGLVLINPATSFPRTVFPSMEIASAACLALYIPLHQQVSAMTVYGHICFDSSSSVSVNCKIDCEHSHYSTACSSSRTQYGAASALYRCL